MFPKDLSIKKFKLYNFLSADFTDHTGKAEVLRMEQDKNKTTKYIGVRGGHVHNLKILNETDIAKTAENAGKRLIRSNCG